MAKIEKPHPGEVLRKDVLERFGISANALAMALHVPATRISEIVRGRRSMSADTALRLERYLERVTERRSASDWMQLQDMYDLAQIGPAERRRIESEVKGGAKLPTGVR